MTFVSNIQSKMHGHVKLDEVICFPQGLWCRGRRAGQWGCLRVFILNKKQIVNVVKTRPLQRWWGNGCFIVIHLNDSRKNKLSNNSEKCYNSEQVAYSRSISWVCYRSVNFCCKEQCSCKPEGQTMFPNFTSNAHYQLCCIHCLNGFCCFCKYTSI